MALTALAIIFVTGVAISTKVLHKKGKLADNPTFKTYFGGMYEGLRQKSNNYWACLSYYELFLTRRLLFAIVCVSLRHEPNLQVICSILLSTIMLAYLGLFRPFVDTSTNLLYIADEIILLVIAILFFTFESTINNMTQIERVSRIGVLVVALIIIHILIHLVCQFYWVYRGWRERIAYRRQHAVLRDLQAQKSARS